MSGAGTCKEAGGRDVVLSCFMREPHSTQRASRKMPLHDKTLSGPQLAPGVSGMRSYGNKRRWLGALSLAALAAAAVCEGGRDTRTAWLDIESRIQYGYFTEDVRALRNLTELLEPGESPDRLKSYYAGLLAYRLTLLATQSSPASEGDRDQARDTVERCVTSLDHALDAQQDFADALALQSACLEILAELRPWRAPFASPRSRSSALIRKARQLAPKNPRVLLLDGIGDYERARAAGGDRERALSKFKKAVAAFEAERQDIDQVPGWGAAEAYVFLARSYLDHGDELAARDALERSLLLAPEFLEARRLLKRITAG